MRNTKVLAYETKDVNLICATVQQPQPQREWSKVGGTMPSKSRRTKSTLDSVVISNLQPSDSGTYNCTASSIAGSMSVTAKLEVYRKLSKLFIICLFFTFSVLYQIRLYIYF